MSAPRLSSRRDAVLREMGLGPIWRLRARHAEVDVTEDSAPEDSSVPSNPPTQPQPQPTQ